MKRARTRNYCSHILAIIFISSVTHGCSRPTEHYGKNNQDTCTVIQNEAYETYKKIEIGKEKYNVLFISLDDANDWINPFGGYPNKTTPKIEDFAESAIVFQNAYSPAPICNASRTSVLLGMHPITTGIYDNQINFRNQEELKTLKTLPQIFMDNGYIVHGAGKIFHYHDKESWHAYQKQAKDPTPLYLPAANQICSGSDRTDPMYYFDWSPLDIDEKDMGDYKVVEFASRFLSEPHDKPFFLGLGLFRPHPAWYTPQKYWDIHPEESVLIPNNENFDYSKLPMAARFISDWAVDHHLNCVLPSGEWKNAARGYLASLSFADDMVGYILKSLANSQYADNTVIVLWSDNGYHLGDKTRWHKSTLWSKASRTPLLIKIPSVKDSFSIYEPVSLTDLFKTLLDICDLDIPKGRDGESLIELISHHGDPEFGRGSITVWQEGNYAIRKNGYSYIQYRDGSSELYNIRDRDEDTNIADNNECVKVDEKFRAIIESLP